MTLKNQNGEENQIKRWGKHLGWNIGLLFIDSKNWKPEANTALDNRDSGDQSKGVVGKKKLIDTDELNS